MFCQTMRRLYFVLSLVVLLCTAGCGFHLRQNMPIPAELQQLILVSDQPYSDLTRSIHAALLANHVTIVEPTEVNVTLPLLKIVSSSFNKSTLSLYQDGATAQYQVVLQVQLTLFYQNKSYPINLVVYHEFLSNPSQPMADSVEQSFLQSEMNTLAAQQLIERIGQLNLANQ